MIKKCSLILLFLISACNNPNIQSPGKELKNTPAINSISNHNDHDYSAYFQNTIPESLSVNSPVVVSIPGLEPSIITPENSFKINVKDPKDEEKDSDKANKNESKNDLNNSDRNDSGKSDKNNSDKADNSGKNESKKEIVVTDIIQELRKVKNEE